MAKEAIRPTSLDGIKRLAKQIKKTNRVKHSEALNLASRAASFENFKHALRSLGSNDNTNGNCHRLFMTFYWQEPRPYRAGRETLEIRLPRPLLEICPKHVLPLARSLSGMRLVAPDHLVVDMVGQSQEYARGELCKAERTLRFMHATGLQPCQHQHAQAAMNELDEKLPRRDHWTYWSDVATGQFILLDEPYSKPEVSSERAAWAHRNGWNLRCSSWAGLYSPKVCPLFVASPARDSFDFEGLVRRIDSMEPPMVADDWSGISTPGLEIFLSPMAITPQDRRRARAKGTIYHVASKTTVPYAAMGGSGRRKPVGGLGIAGHGEAGRLIKALLGSAAKPWAVNERLETLRCTLEDWMSMEIASDDLPGRDYIDVYYNTISEADPLIPAVGSSDGVIAMLGRLKDMLVGSYPDCAPLRRLTGRIDTAVALTSRYAQRARSRRR